MNRRQATWITPGFPSPPPPPPQPRQYFFFKGNQQIPTLKYCFHTEMLGTQVVRTWQQCTQTFLNRSLGPANHFKLVDGGEILLRIMQEEGKKAIISSKVNASTGVFYCTRAYLDSLVEILPVGLHFYILNLFFFFFWLIHGNGLVTFSEGTPEASLKQSRWAAGGKRKREATKDNMTENYRRRND